MITIDHKSFEYLDNQPISGYLAADAPLPLAARSNNRFCDLRTVPGKGEEISLLGLGDRDGFFCYRQTLIFLFAAAVSDVMGSLPITVRRSVNKATYCEIVGAPAVPDSQTASRIKARMQELVSANLFIEKTTLPQSEAAELLRSEGNSAQADAVAQLAGTEVSLYSIGGAHFHMCGVLALRTGVIDVFDLSEYQQGFLLQYPNYATGGKIPPFGGLHQFIYAMEEYSIWEDVLSVHNVSDLNRLVKSGQTREMILMQEALHEKKIAQIADAIKSGMPDKKVVLITGPSSAGKTTFANKLNILLRAGGLTPVTISLDDYYVDLEYALRHEDGTFNFEELESIDYQLFNQHLSALIAGEEVEIPRFSFGVAKRMQQGRRLKLKEGQIVVVEGIHALNDRLTPSVPAKNKFKIYISPLGELAFDNLNPISPTDTRLLRRLVRDYNFRHSSAQNTFEMWPSVQKGEVKNIFPCEEKADMEFNSSIIYEFSVYKRYAVPILRSIVRSSVHYPNAQHLLELLGKFEVMEDDKIPTTSLIREFIGGSIYYGAQ